jgi:isoquinoline 1-oxidoreductase subunit beta
VSETHATHTKPQINRRAFVARVAATGGALALGFDIPFGPRSPCAAEQPPEITAWIVIEPDDIVTIRIAKSEMGQGSFTGLSMLVAEELACDWSKVRPQFVAPHENLARKRVWGDMSTGGSRSIRMSHLMLRKAGATAREMLIAAAAAQWNVAPTECHAANSMITHGPTGRSVTFGKVATAAAKIDPPKDIKLKEPKDWNLIGKPTRRLEALDKIQGQMTYGIDIRVPNMLYAALVQCPIFKGTLASVDDSRAVGMSGVRKIIKPSDAVAVVADTWWQAKRAADALSIIWDDRGNGNVSSESIKEFLRTGLDATEAGVGRQQGNVTEALGQAARRIEAEYYAPFLAHATMEPQNCTAHVVGDKVEIWLPTQSGEAALAAAARAARVPPRNVVVHKTMLGGGFGRRAGIQDVVPAAVHIAKEMGQPVKTIWTREEDMRHDFYRPVAMARMTSGLDEAGRPIAWRVRLTGNSIRATLTPQAIRNGVDTEFQEGFIGDMPYDVPNYLADYAMRNTHVPVGFWRCVNHTQNCFFKESFVDELAHAAGADPYEYRRNLLGKGRRAERLLVLLDAAARASGWGTPLPSGFGRGIAIEEAFRTYVAGVAEVSVGDDGRVRVHRFVLALDPGIVVNPLSIEMQVQSGVVFGLTAALYGEITIANGRVKQSNFDDYPMLRMAEMPKVETLVLSTGGFRGGIGEPPVAVVAPALCNAIFAATGKRIRALPIKNHDLRRV